MLELADINTNDTDSIKYIIKFLKQKTMIVTQEFLKLRNVSIPISLEDYINE